MDSSLTNRRAFCFAAAVFVLTFLIAGDRAFAQQTVTSAALSGRITDASGALVTNAALTTTNLETNQKRTANTDYDGRFRFPYLQVGAYKLLVRSAKS
jgi:hypothetical protein